MKKVAILQSCYIPWKGYFDIINSVDEFIFYDEVQFTKNDWRNRNLIKTPLGTEWLTIPVHGSISKSIQEIETTGNRWATKHWKTLNQIYAKAKYLNYYRECFKNLYQECEKTHHLSVINYRFIAKICEILNIKTKLTWSKDYKKILDSQNKNLRLIELCQNTNAKIYLSGPSAKNYLDEKLFIDHAIQVQYIDYENYPMYQQLYGDFIHTVSIIDLIFNEGPNAKLFMKSFN